MTAYAAICDEGNLHKIAYRLNTSVTAIATTTAITIATVTKRATALCMKTTAATGAVAKS